MAPSSVLLVYMLCSLLSFCSLQTVVVAIETVAPTSVNLTYYLHEIRGGPGTNGTLFPAAGTGSDTPQNLTAVGWGTFFVLDIPINDSNDTNATVIGKATGFAVVSNKAGIRYGGVQLYCKHIFNNASSYDKSSIAIVAQVDFMNEPPWEGIVTGGTGFFRGWGGYGIAELLTAIDAPTVVYKWSMYLSK